MDPERMNINSLPYEIVTSCFSYLNSELLANIVLLENIDDHIVRAVADHLNHLCYSKRTLGIYRGTIRGIEGIAGIEAYYETDFDRFQRIHKILEEKSLKCPLWFHYSWNDTFQMHQSLDEIKLVYNGQGLGIHGYMSQQLFDYPIFPDHDINLKITCLSLSFAYNCCINLDNFPRLKTFYGTTCEIIVDNNHPSLENLYLREVTFSSLPINLIKLVAKRCWIKMNENHPKLKALTVLALEGTRDPFITSALLPILWNKYLEHFSYIGYEVTDVDELISMIGPRVLHFGFAGSLFSTIPQLLLSLNCNRSSGFFFHDRIGLQTLSDFTQMTSLTLNKPSHITGTLILPPNLLKLSIRSASSNVFAKVEFPPKLVDLELEQCGITLTTGWLNSARLKRLSLSRNKLSSFNAFLPCCEFLCLSDNKIKRVQIEAPVLEHIDLSENMLRSIPKLPASLQVLVLSNNRLRLSRMSEFPSNLKLLDLSGAGYGAPKKYTFPSSIEELNLTNLDLPHMRGVKFVKGSKLKELNMSICRLKKISDRMIELPLGLKSLNLGLNRLQNIDDLTIPQTVTLLDLRHNNLKSIKVKSHFETLELSSNIRLSGLTIPKDLELKVLDIKGVGFRNFSFDLVGAEKLTRLRLGREFEVIDLTRMPANFQILEYPGECKIEGLHRYPNTDIYRRHEFSYIEMNS